jgi:hypothetical protein
MLDNAVSTASWRADPVLLAAPGVGDDDRVAAALDYFVSYTSAGSAVGGVDRVEA